MKEIEFEFIGWVKEGEAHDKVWTAFRIGNTCYAGWGRRGKTLRFKKYDYGYDMYMTIDKKRKKYKEVDSFQLFTIFPYFKDEVSKYLTAAILTDSVM